MKEAENNEQFSYDPVQSYKDETDDEENFETPTTKV
jgi:hypothetical protein